MRASRFVLLSGLAGLTVASASCSLAGLDHFRVASCTGDCAQLNARDGLDPNGCHVWQCNATGEFCELPAVRDHDHDGFAPIACGGTDCNDDDRGSAQGAAETCDGLDNDCNGIVDDVAPSATTRPPDPTPVLDGATSPTFVGYGGTSDGVVVAWRSGASTELAVVDQVDASTTPHALTGSTNAMPTQALASADASEGCPLVVRTSLAPPACDGSGGCATAGWVCVGGDHCAPPVVGHVPPAVGECTTHEECQDGVACNGRELCDPTSTTAVLDARGCRAADDVTPCGTTDASCDELHDACVLSTVGACSFADLALDPIGATEWLALAVTTDGCAVGRARTGWIEASASPSLVLWGDHRLSTTWGGVDVDSLGCTGASRDPSAARGAAGAAVAALPIDPAHGRSIPQGLAAWRAAPVCSGTGGCPAMTPATADVEILGLWRERGDAGGTPIRWVDGSDDGTPRRLVDASAGTRPSVTSWALGGGAAGYAVAYPRSGGGVSIALVHAFTTTAATALAPACAAPVPPVCLAPDPGPDAAIGTMDDGESSTRVAMPGSARTTPTLGMPIADVIATGETPAGDVAITTGAVASGSSLVSLALAWATTTEVVLVPVTYDPSSDAVTEGTAMRFAATGATDVSVVHLASGLVDATGTTRATGGLVVTWSTPSGTYAVRVTDEDGMAVRPGVVRLGEPSDHPRAFVDAIPATGTTLASSAARVVAHQGDRFVVFPTVCGASP